MRHRARLAFIVFAVITLSACTGTPAGVTPVTGFDAERYTGRWYEIYRLDHRFERGLTQVTAEYQLRDDGKVSVTNRGFDPDACEWSEIEGSARFLEDADTGSLAVSFFFGISGGYHVIALDHEGYGYSMVSGPTRDYLWILARSPELDNEVADRLIRQARELGFPTAELIRVEHGEQDCP